MLKNIKDCQLSTPDGSVMIFCSFHFSNQSCDSTVQYEIGIL